MWRFHSLLVISREFIWIKESKKKIWDIFVNVFTENQKEKNVNIHRFDHIQSFNKYSIFSFKSLFMSLIFEVSQHWFFNSIQGIAWTDKLETKAFFLFSFETEIWPLGLCLPYRLITSERIERRKDVDPFWTSFSSPEEEK